VCTERGRWVWIRKCTEVSVERRPCVGMCSPTEGHTVKPVGETGGLYYFMLVEVPILIFEVEKHQEA